MSKKGNNGAPKVDDKGMEQASWVTISERRREIIFNAMGRGGNFSSALKEIFSYIEYLKREIQFCEDILNPLIRGLNSTGGIAEEIRTWNQIINRKN